VDIARSLPAGIRRSGGIGTDRRPQCRLEGSRVLVELFDVHPLAPGRRQGYTAESCEVPGPTESPREIRRALCGVWGGVCSRSSRQSPRKTRPAVSKRGMTMSARDFVRSIVVLSFWTCSTLPAMAQGVGAIGGTISDPSGAVLPGVTVTLSNPRGTIGGNQETVTDARGAFQFIRLVP